MALDDYNPSTALTAYYPTRDERRPARLWATEKLLHDLKAAGLVDFFEGSGSNPTTLDGYASTKVWLRVSSGVTEAPGEIRAYDGAGDASLLENWPELTAAGFAAFLGPPTQGQVAAAGAFMKASDTSDAIAEGETKLLMTVAERAAVARLDRISAFAFGLDLSPEADNTAAINAALAYSAANGVTIVHPIGTAFYEGELVFPDGARWHAAVPFRSIIKKSNGNTNRALITENFDDLTGTSDGYAADVPQYIEMVGLIFDGNYMTAARAAYVNTSGGGLFLFARKMKLDLVVQNQAGIGVWSECPPGNPSPLDLGFPPSADVHLRIDTTKEEGLIWKGPVDVELKHVLQWNAGARIADDEFDGAVSSPTYGGTNGGYTDGVVFDRGAEVGMIHSFGNYAGGGIIVNDGRINADLLMAESCHFGGIHLLGGQGMIDRLDVHRCGGYMADTRPDFFYNAIGTGNVGYRINQLSNHNISFPGDRGPCNRIVIGSSARWLTCLLWEIKANTRAGHGLVVEDGADFIQMLGGVVHQCQGEAEDTLDSTAILRKSDGNHNIEIEAEVIQCDVVFNSDGTPHNEKIKIRYRIDSDQTAFAGTLRSLPGQMWDISGHVGSGNGNANWFGSKNDVAFTFDSTSSAEQSATVAHKLIGAPAFARMQCSLVDPGTDINVAVDYFFIGDSDDTNITVIYKQASTTGVNTTPRVWVHAEI